MRALKQFFRCRPFLGGLAVAATLCLIGILLPSAWSLLVGGLAILLLLILASFGIPSIFDRLLRSFFDRYPLVGQVLGLMLAAGLAALAIADVYGAGANGTFTLHVGGSLLFLLLLFAFLSFAAWAYREERLSDQRFRNRPPIDEAIRRSIDER